MKKAAAAVNFLEISVHEYFACCLEESCKVCLHQTIDVHKDFAAFMDNLRKLGWKFECSWKFPCSAKQGLHVFNSTCECLLIFLGINNLIALYSSTPHTFKHYIVCVYTWIYFQLVQVLMSSWNFSYCQIILNIWKDISRKFYLLSRLNAYFNFPEK